MSLSPILVAHVGGGTVGLLSGAVALSSRKGTRPHKIAGKVFLISMLTASAGGAFLGFRNSEWDNVFGGVLVFYLVATAWITARREEGETGIVVDVIGLLVALAIAALAAIYGIEAAQSPTGTIGRSAASDFIVPVAVATLAAIGDARILIRGGLRGSQRIARHLWRMCFALFIASAAIFVARPQLFPAFLSKTHILFALGILPLILMLFWLTRVLLTNAFKRTAVPYWTHQGAASELMSAIKPSPKK